ncbi:uncharacterized protein LOC123273069 [Cotesia glomerata]|uniref:uncharacterized protein LOC123273069 n=1 Tax=Cotesia glomerata TaxID=32391 RepID=UPI001D01C051|nr:uncharacterized protein LOC123273069 [Cotesia glomerata]
MSTANREKKRRVSYFVGLDNYDDSENENKNDKNKKEQEEIYGWDLFRFIPLKAKTGSMVETRLYELCLQIIRVIAYASIFTIVIVSGVIAKSTILFAISQLERKDRLIYCEYNEYGEKTFNLSAEKYEY